MDGNIITFIAFYPPYNNGLRLPLIIQLNIFLTKGQCPIPTPEFKPRSPFFWYHNNVKQITLYNHAKRKRSNLF